MLERIQLERVGNNKQKYNFVFKDGDTFASLSVISTHGGQHKTQNTKHKTQNKEQRTQNTNRKTQNTNRKTILYSKMGTHLQV